MITIYHDYHITTIKNTSIYFNGLKKDVTTVIKKKKKRFMGSNVYGAFNEKKYIYNVLKGHYIIIITIRECL